MWHCVGRLAPALQRGIVFQEGFFIFFTGEFLACVLVILSHKHRAVFGHLLHGEITGKAPVFIAIDAVLVVLASIGVCSVDIVC